MLFNVGIELTILGLCKRMQWKGLGVANLISRRQFAGIAGGVALPLLSPALSFSNSPEPQKTLRVIAYNIYGGKGWPKERPLARQAVAKKQMAARLAQELELHAPDIICFSESPSESITRDIAERAWFSSCSLSQWRQLARKHC